jgi:hypothetical protein
MATECNWTNNNLACVNSWAFLRVLKQFKNVFGDAGTLKMRQFTYWDPSASPDVRRTAALGLASQLDNMFINGVGAKYEPGYNRTKAVTAMADVLVSADKTLCEFSATVDEAYRFTGEKM